MEKILEKSIRLARKLHNPSGQKFNVYAFIYDGRKLLSVGHNQMLTQTNKALYLAKRFNISHMVQFPFAHAETDAISRLWGKRWITGRETLCVVRLLKNGEIATAKPCDNCSKILDALNITRIIHT